MTIPEPYALVLLALGVMRLTRLVGWDTITDGLRSRLTGWKSDGRPVTYRRERRGDVSKDWNFRRQQRQAWMKFLTCPWCAGFWISLVCWGSWQIWPHATLVAMTPLALNEIVGLVVKTLDE